MLNKIIDYSLRNKLMVFVGIFLLILVGAKQVYELPVDAVPDITDNQVQIITTSPALGAPDIERLITLPIELATNNLPGLKKNRSISRFGLSVVTLVFEENIDIYRARQQVSERLITVQNQIPKEYGTPELAPVTTGLGEIYQYVLHTQPGFENKYSLMELRTIQDWLVRRQLLGIKGVADIASFGGQLKQYEVSVNPYKLQASNTSIDEVFDALETNNQNSGGSYIEKGPNVLFIRTEGLLKTTEEIEQVCIKQLNNGTPLLIKDVAKVKMGYANRYGALTYNGKGEAVGGVVMMLKGENSKKVIERVKERVAEIQKTLPKGVVVEPYLDRTKMVNNAISTVLKNLIEGALIVIIVLILFLANWRAGFIVASIIPLSMLFAVCMMNLFGVSGNLMSLGALDFGLIVDGAVIIVEAVLHYLTKQAASSSFISTSKQEQDNMIKNISSKMMKSALFGQLIILLVYVPILSLQGIEGKMFKPMAQTVIFALMGAVILALTYVPVITSVLISIKPNAAHGWVEKGMERLERYYVSILKKAVNNGYKIMGTIALLFMVSVSVLMNRGGEFIPELPEGDFAVETRLLTGANLSTSINVCLEAQKILLKKFPNEVEKVVGKTGSSEIPTDPMPFEQTDLIIALKKRSDWKVAKTYNQLADSMQKELETITGVSFSFMYPVAMRFNELMTGARQDVVCKVFGDNLDTLVKYAGTMGNLFKNVKGAENIYVEPLNGIPQLVVNYSRPKIAEFGLDVNKINRSVNANFAGQYAGNIFEEQKQFDLVVRMENDLRIHPEELNNLLIPDGTGHQIPLNSLATVTLKSGVNQIQRENAQRRIIVGFNIKNRDIESVVNEIKNKIDHQVKLPTGYHITFGGSFENLTDAKNRLTLAVPLALLLIFFVLYFVFHSVKKALLIYVAIPLSAIGGIFGLYIRDMPFSISAGIGFIALFGVAVLNGLVLVSEFESLKRTGIKNSLKIIFIGGASRLRPVLMTAMVASLGFLPMALSTGEGAEVQKPLATVVIFGLLLSTFLTLFILPILFVYSERKKPSIKIKTIMFIGVILTSFTLSSNAQTPVKITLQQAIDTTLKNNLQIAANKAELNYLTTKAQGINEPSFLAVGFNYGHINSAYIDNEFSVNQTFKWPSYYSSAKKVAATEAQIKEVQNSLNKDELIKEVKQNYFLIQVLQSKLTALSAFDSLMLAFSDKASLKYQVGESNLLEKVTAQSQAQLASIQLAETKKEYKQTVANFNFLIGSKTLAIPDGKVEENDMAKPIESTLINKQVNYLTEGYTDWSLNKIKQSKNKLMPEFGIGYTNMSIYGFGNDDLFYSYAKRFGAVNFSLGVPLFYKPYAKAIKADKLWLEKTKLQNQWMVNNYTLKLKNAQTEWQNAYHNFQLFKESTWQTASQMDKTAEVELSAGQINYIDWINIQKNILQIKLTYYDLLLKINQAAAEVEFLSNQK